MRASIKGIVYASSVPEPASLFLFGTGILAIGLKTLRSEKLEIIFSMVVKRGCSRMQPFFIHFNKKAGDLFKHAPYIGIIEEELANYCYAHRQDSAVFHNLFPDKPHSVEKTHPPHPIHCSMHHAYSDLIIKMLLHIHLIFRKRFPNHGDLSQHLRL
jgi:hypothetical protein